MTLLTIKEAAVEIRMSEGWVKKAIRRGDLLAIRFGRSVRIRPEDLEEYVRKIAVNVQSVAQEWERWAVTACREI